MLYQMPQVLVLIAELHQVLRGHSGCHSPRATKIQHHRGWRQGLRDEGLVILRGHKGKVVEVQVVGVEGSGGRNGGAALGRICKIGCSILGASFSIFSITLAILAFSFALLSFLSFALGRIGLLGIVPGPVIPR